MLLYELYNFSFFSVKTASKSELLIRNSNFFFSSRYFKPGLHFKQFCRVHRNFSPLTLKRRCLVTPTQKVLYRALSSPREMPFPLQSCCLCMFNKTWSACLAFKLLSKMRVLNKVQTHKVQKQRISHELGWFYCCRRTFKLRNTLISSPRLLRIYCCPASEINPATAMIIKWRQKIPCPAWRWE